MSITMPVVSRGWMFGGAPRRASRLGEAAIPTSRLEKYLTTQHAITQIIARSAELEQALPGILKAICETAGWDFGEVWYVDRSDNQLYCQATWSHPSLSFPEFGESGWEIRFAPGMGLPGLLTFCMITIFYALRLPDVMACTVVWVSPFAAKVRSSAR